MPSAANFERREAERLRSLTFFLDYQIGRFTVAEALNPRMHAMNIKPIQTKADHCAALKEIESLMMARSGTPEGDRLDVLVTLVEAYEKKTAQDR